MSESSSNEEINDNVYSEANDEKCYVCKCNEAYDDNPMIFCDGCDLIVHQYCYGLLSIPKNEWFCEMCVAKSLGFKNIVLYVILHLYRNVIYVN